MNSTASTVMYATCQECGNAFGSTACCDKCINIQPMPYIVDDKFFPYNQVSPVITVNININYQETAHSPKDPLGDRGPFYEPIK
jgi:hypothetical protein